MGPADDMPDHAAPLHRFAAELQVLAGAMGWGSTPRDLLQRFNLLLDMTSEMGRADQIVSAQLLSKTLMRLHRSFGLPSASPYDGCGSLSELRRGFALLKAQRQATSARLVAGFLEILKERHTDPDLSESDVAVALNRSTSHLSRLLNRETGHRFEWHLRAVRVEHARRLLARSNRSMKEIAALAGFSSTAEFDHQFKSVCGITPSLHREHTRCEDRERTQKNGDRL